MDWSFLNNFTVFPTAFFTLFWATLMSLLLVSILFGMLDFDMDMDVDPDTGSLGSFLVNLGISKVPLIISMSIVFTIGLAISYFLQFGVFNTIGLLTPPAEDSSLFSVMGIMNAAIGLVLILVVFVVSLYIAGPICKKMEPIFCRDIKKAFNPIGKECIIITPTVSETYGEAKIVEDNKEFVISVYIDSNEEIKIKDTCYVVKRHEERDKYLIKKA